MTFNNIPEFFNSKLIHEIKHLFYLLLVRWITYFNLKYYKLSNNNCFNFIRRQQQKEDKYQFNLFSIIIEKKRIIII